jgi:hypothetical protein
MSKLVLQIGISLDGRGPTPSGAALHLSGIDPPTHCRNPRSTIDALVKHPPSATAADD